MYGRTMVEIRSDGGWELQTCEQRRGREGEKEGVRVRVK